jgi:hypothetical protein
MRVDDDPSKPFLQWVPLIFALRWAEQHPEPPPVRSGGELLSAFVQNLGREPEYPVQVRGVDT